VQFKINPPSDHFLPAHHQKITGSTSNTLHRSCSEFTFKKVGRSSICDSQGLTHQTHSEFPDNLFNQASNCYQPEFTILINHERHVHALAWKSVSTRSSCLEPGNKKSGTQSIFAIEFLTFIKVMKEVFEIKGFPQTTSGTPCTRESVKSDGLCLHEVLENSIHINCGQMWPSIPTCLRWVFKSLRCLSKYLYPPLWCNYYQWWGPGLKDPPPCV